MSTLDELVRVAAVVGVVVGCGLMVLVAALVVSTPRRGETGDLPTARLDAVMPPAEQRPGGSSVEVVAIQTELLRIQTEMMRRALTDDIPARGPVQVDYENGVPVRTLSARTAALPPAAERATVDDPPPVRRGDDRGQAGVGAVVFFVVGLLVVGYIGTHGVAEAKDRWNEYRSRVVRAVTDGDASRLFDHNGDRAGRADGRRWGSTTTAELRASLGRVEVVEERPAVDGYAREEFGPAWTDEYQGPAGGNDCDTRNDVLAVQMRQVEREDGCVVAVGTLADPYTGRTIRFDQDADASAVQIDHVVPLSVAWDMGASEWSEDERRVFANDAARNLVASDGTANMSKSDHPPAEWLPPNRAARCEYLRRYLVVSNHYELPITEADAAVVREQAPRCASGGQGRRSR